MAFFFFAKFMADSILNVHDYTWQVIVNPNACDCKCLNNWNDIASKLDENSVKYELHQAQGSKKGIEIAKQLCAQGCRHLMVIGGDGTINEVVNGIMLSGIDTREVYLAVIPFGRGNDWARTHQFPKNFLQSIDVFANGKFICHDIGKVQTVEQEKVLEERYFANIAGFGFDAEVIYDTVYKRPHFMGISVYVLSLARCLFKYRSTPVQIKAPGFDFQNKVFTMAVAICQYNGGGMRQAPMAKPDDGLLDVVAIKKISKLRVMTLVKSLFDGSHIQKAPKKVVACQTDHVSISSPKLFRAEVEGELLSTGRYEVSVLPNALNMLTNRP